MSSVGVNITNSTGKRVIKLLVGKGWLRHYQRGWFAVSDELACRTCKDVSNRESFAALLAGGHEQRRRRSLYSDRMSRAKKAKISVTIDYSLAKEIEDYFRERLAEAAKTEKDVKNIPTLSTIYEEVIQRGWDEIKKQRKRG